MNVSRALRVTVFALAALAGGSALLDPCEHALLQALVVPGPQDGQDLPVGEGAVRGAGGAFRR